jgi:hypothetical protein
MVGILGRAEKDPELRTIIEANYQKIVAFKEQKKLRQYL